MGLGHCILEDLLEGVVLGCNIPEDLWERVGLGCNTLEELVEGVGLGVALLVVLGCSTPGMLEGILGCTIPEPSGKSGVWP